MGLPEASVAFLRDLDANNNKEWFQANKKRYESDFKKPARALVEEINALLEDLSPAHVTPPNKSVNRINRDIRFSADKTPYNVKLWAKFMNQEVPKDANAGFYFGLDLESVGVGAGAWVFPKAKLEQIRSYFADTYGIYQGIVTAKDFAAYAEVGGDGLKRVPKPWPADHPAAELLKLKGIHTRRQLDFDLITSDDLARVVVEEFAKLQPFVDYVQKGLDG